MDYMAETTLNEKDSLQDMLNLEKTIVKVYATAMTEGVSKGFRDVVYKHLNDTCDDQLNVFMQMTELGYAKVQSAEDSVLQAEKEKFSKAKQTFS